VDKASLFSSTLKLKIRNEIPFADILGISYIDSTKYKFESITVSTKAGDIKLWDKASNQTMMNFYLKFSDIFKLHEQGKTPPITKLLALKI